MNESAEVAYMTWIEKYKNMCYDYYDKKTDDNEKSLGIRINVFW